MEGRQATGAYARGISTPPDDLSSQLERLLDEPPRDDAVSDASASDPMEPPPPDPPDLVAVLEGTQQAMEDQLDELRGQLDDAFNEMADRIARTDVHLAALRTATEKHAAAQTAARAQADDALAAHLAADRLHLEAGLDQLRRDVVAWRVAPVSLDTRPVEDTVHQEALRTAADIATLAHEVETLGSIIRRQDSRLAELHATLDWIKQRLLNR